MMRLWRATTEVVVYIAAETIEDAAFEALEAIRQEIDRNGLYEVDAVEEVRTIGQVEPKWRDAIPWGENVDDRTCTTILEAVRLAAQAQPDVPAPGGPS
jgi:hypothetical protein